MKIVNHSNSRGFFAFAPDVRRHESSENCQKCCSPFPLQIYIFFSEWRREHQSKVRLGATVLTKVGQYVQLGVNVLAHTTLKYLCLSGIVRHIYQKTLSQIHSHFFESTVSIVTWNILILDKAQLIGEDVYLFCFVSDSRWKRFHK